jgi:hypothetical protein
MCARSCYDERAPATTFQRKTLDFEKVLMTIARYFEREGVKFAVIGAFALHAYGRSRLTQDLDFVTEAAGQAALIAYLESLGYQTLHRSEGYSNHLHSDSAMGRVDFVYVRGETRRKIFETQGATLKLGNLSVPVPRAEHLVAMKVQAMKNDPSRTLQELADIGFLIHLPGIDQEEVRKYFEEGGLLNSYEEIRKRT